MPQDKPIPIATSIPGGAFVAPTPQNTPLNPAPIGSGLSKPTVPDIAEEDKESGSEGDEDDALLDDPTGTAALKATMLGMVQGKLASLIGKSSGYIESLPLPVKKRVEGLKGVHVEFTKLEAEYKKELTELERKYLGLYKPLFDRRREITTGAIEPTDDEVKAGEEQTLKDDPEAVTLAEAAKNVDPEEATKDVKGVPEFWLTALRNHIDISSLITERDEEALRALTDVRLEYLPGTTGYVITFHFGTNDYFTNEVLTKTYYYQPELGYGGDFVYSHAEGTKIDWKADKDLTKTVEVRKQRNKNTNRTRVVRKTKATPSFFDFFSPPVPAEEEAIKSGDIEDEELAELDYKLEVDYQIGEDLKERVIPRAIDYFTGKALEYDEDDEDDSFGDEEDDDDDGAHISDDDEEEVHMPPPKKKGGKGGKGGNDQECKNQ